jgi:hypothetical protein
MSRANEEDQIQTLTLAGLLAAQKRPLKGKPK